MGRTLLASRKGATDTRFRALVFPGERPAFRVDAGDIVQVERAVALWRRRLASAGGGAFAPRAAKEVDLVRRTRRRLRRLVRSLSTLLPPDRETLHAARIAAKKVRYAVEVLEPLAPKLHPLLRLLRSFQDAAGDAHDLDELSARIGALATATDADSRLGLSSLAKELEADTTRALAVARRQGKTLAGPVSRLHESLGAAESR